MQLLEYYPLFLLIALALDKPYMILPNHHHFGVWSWWAYFDRPVRHIPKNVVTGNQGWFRIYLHYFFVAFFKLFGRQRLLLKLRLFNSAYNALTALAVCAVAQQAGFQAAQGVVAAVLFLYLISRPQMTSYFVNAEPFAVLFTTLALGTLLASRQALPGDPVQAAWWFFAFSLVYALTTLLNKLNHAVEYAVLFTAYCLMTGLFSPWLAAGLAGWAVGTGIFFVCFRRYLHKEGAACFFNYLTISSGMSLAALIDHHRIYLLPVLAASGHILFAALLGMDLFGQAGPSSQIVGVFLAASLVGLCIQRTFLYHHWIAVLPFVALCSAQFLFAIPALPAPWSWLAGACLLVPALARLPKDLTAYAFRDPYALAAYVFGPESWRFFDPRCQAAEALSREAPYADERVMFWSIHVQLYVQTDRVPVCMEQPFCAASVYLFNPNYDQLLADCLPAKRPRYVFDLNALGSASHYGYFAPLLIYLRTGLLYRPREIRRGILVYELDAVEAPLRPRPSFPLLTEVGSQERTLVWENFKELFHVLPGNDHQLLGQRLLVGPPHFFEFVEEALRRRLPEEPAFPAVFKSRPLAQCSLRLQLLSWLSPEAVAAVSAPNALPLYLALMCHSVGKTGLARQYEELLDPVFVEKCAPLSLGFTLGLAFLRVAAGLDETLDFPADKALYFSERPHTLTALLRLLYTRLSAPELSDAELERIERVLGWLHIETGHPSAVDEDNRACHEHVRSLLAAKRKALAA